MSHIKKTLTVCLCLQGENGKAVVEVRHLEAFFFFQMGPSYSQPLTFLCWFQNGGDALLSMDDEVKSAQVRTDDTLCFCSST